jgi:glutamate racemase
VGAIGVFDSGVGGLSVLHEIRRVLPEAHLLYIADSAHAPYGDKSEAFIVDRSRAIAEFLVAHGASALVVACNTATASAVDALRAAHTLPIVGIEPGVKPAVRQTRSGVVGVLTTSRTASSPRFQRLVERHQEGVRIIVRACPGWVQLVEQGALDGEATRAAVEKVVRPILGEGADVLVLGCTHYSFLAPVIRSVADDAVHLVDPAPAVARHLKSRLEAAGLTASGDDGRPLEVWTSAAPSRIQDLVTYLWGARVQVHALPPPTGRDAAVTQESSTTPGV